MIPCALLALAVHPSTSHNIVNRISWAFCVYLEAVSVLPQLRMMQNTKVKPEHSYCLLGSRNVLLFSNIFPIYSKTDC